jgi:hypothetical protein
VFLNPPTEKCKIDKIGFYVAEISSDDKNKNSGRTSLCVCVCVCLNLRTANKRRDNLEPVRQSPSILPINQSQQLITIDYKPT